MNTATLSHPAPQGSPEWMTERLGRLTASEMYKLMSAPRNKADKLSQTALSYIMDKVAEVITGVQPEQFDSMAMAWGRDNEPLARQWYAKKTGNSVEETGFVPYGPDAGGSPDGLVGEAGIVEIKCPYNTSNHLWNCLMTEESIKADAPEYYWQIQSNLLFTGRSWCHFISFDPRIDHSYGLFILQVNRNEEDIELIKAKLSAATSEIDSIINHLKSLEA